MAGTALAIEEYMAVGNPEQDSRKTTEKETTSPLMEKVVKALVVRLKVRRDTVTLLETMVLEPFRYNSTRICHNQYSAMEK